MVGIDVSEPSIAESRIVLSRGNIKNVEIKLASAFELVEYFTKDEFNVCLSIDVFEHLHPDDAKDHLQQVFQVLKPGGKYIIVTPNRLTGPHDITRDVFPEEREARGFHLNETTYSEIINIMRAIGFNKFRCFFPLKLPKKNIKLIIVPYNLIIIFESLYRVFPNLLRFRVLERLIAIHLIAYKPETF
jgi:SAM-dependent methyltransferase